ncbi:MAG: potassium channel family protein [Chloroflexota bacterium]|nr:potassium channel family protein [Chloroflexota bacterium]
MLAALLTMVGVILIGVALRDTFETVFHPGWPGSLSGGIHRLVWRGAHRVASRSQARLRLAGPVAMLTSVGVWVLLLVVGWASVIWPRLPGGFRAATSLRPGEQGGGVDALYVSLVTLATLGYGDLTPREDWLRLVLPLEALIGFALISAAISWVLSVYPALGRRRGLARQVTLLTEILPRAGLADGQATPEVLGPQLAALTRQVITVQHDFTQFPVTYYFAERDRRSALPVALAELLPIVAVASRSEHPPEIRLPALMLQAATRDLLGLVAEHYLHRSPTDVPDDLCVAYARDHGHELSHKELGQASSALVRRASEERELR